MALKIICDYMGWKPDGYHLQLDKPIGPRNRVADATKLKSLGWRPSVTFEDGLRKTIDWYVRTHNVEDLKRDLERKLTER
jgi:dTDP-glucose 4,6-dehydratase